MTNKKSTKRALLSSVLSLALCLTMLIGTTFAWFTDSVTSSNNIIKSGKLDVTMEWMDGKLAVADDDSTSWKDASTDAIFNYDLWEPGYVSVRHVKIANEGSLALKYKLNIIANGEVSELADVIDVYYVDPATQIADRTQLTDDKKIGTLTEVLAGLSTTGTGALVPAGKEGNGLKSVEKITIALKMQESAGNEYQGKSIGTDFSVQLLATQYAYEEDSFNNQYDVNAPALVWDGSVDTSWYNASESKYEITRPEQLAGLAKLVNEEKISFAKKTITLGGDIDLNNLAWTPIGVKAGDANAFAGTFDGNGYTIYNLNVSGGNWIGLFGYAYAKDTPHASIYNVHIVNATVVGTNYIGAVLGGGFLSKDCIAGCTVENAMIIAQPTEKNGVYDDAAKAGVIAGYVMNGDIYNNKAINSSVYAYRDLGGIVGYASGDSWKIKAYGNTVENVTLNYAEITPYAGGNENNNMDHFVGRKHNLTMGTNHGEAVLNTVATKVAVVETAGEAAFDAAVKDGATTVVLGDGAYIVPDSAQGKTMTIIGTGDTVIATQDDGSYEGCDYSLDGATVTFKNITITTDSSTYTGYARLTATYDNCTINGTYTLYRNSVFNNCTFNVSGDVYNIWTWGAPSATFNGCTFNTSGKAILHYGGDAKTLTVNNCVFNDDNAYADVNNKAAIEVGSDWDTDTKEVIANNVKVNGFDVTDKGLNTGSTLWGNKNSLTTSRLNVVIDGVDVY